MIASVSPVRGIRRAQARELLAYYEAAKPTRLRRITQDKSSGDLQVSQSASTLRDIARQLERDHDLVRGIENVLVRNAVGAKGIQCEPMPKRKSDGRIHDDFATQLRRRYDMWSARPEVTWRMSRAKMERLVCRGWIRDGEALGQMLSGKVSGLDHGTDVPFSLELIEPDLLPLDFDDAARGIRQGIQRNMWGRPEQYHFYKSHPGDYGGYLFGGSATDMRIVPANRILHLAMIDRYTQLRGVSLFASVITRLEDLKDYEESERIAAKIAASMAAYIKKGNPDTYSGAPLDEQGKPIQRTLKFAPGMVFDNLGPGEEIGMIDTKRPNPNVQVYRNGQIAMVAAGVDVGKSSISRNYDGNYSAQRQELVEQYGSYAILTEDFVTSFTSPARRQMILADIMSGRTKIPADVDESTIYDADFRGPPMPWIKPTEEIEALRMQRDAGFKSTSAIVRERGGTLTETWLEIRSDETYREDLKLPPFNTGAAGARPLQVENVNG